MFSRSLTIAFLLLAIGLTPAIDHHAIVYDAGGYPVGARLFFPKPKPYLAGFPGSGIKYPSVCASGTYVEYLTSSSTSPLGVDQCFNAANNTIQAIGGGAGGGTLTGSAGGNYAAGTNVALTPGTLVGFSVGVKGSGASNQNGNVGGATWLCNATTNCASLAGSAVVVGAAGGTIGSVNVGAVTTTLNDVGAVKFAGGGTGTRIAGQGASGGGGAAGPDGAGIASANPTAGAGSNGGNSDNNADATGGATGNPPTAGGNGTKFDASHGSGAGGGGVGLVAVDGAPGGCYGGGGGGSEPGGSNLGGDACGGLLRIRWITP